MDTSLIKSPSDLNLINGKILYNNQLLEANISINNGKIIKIGKKSNIPKADIEIDLNSKIVLPGMIDVHVHCRDLDLSYKEDFFTSTAAAVHGGITTILDMPNTKPPTTSLSILKEKVEKAKNKILCNVGFYSGVPKDLEQLKLIGQFGVFGIKLLLNNPITDYNYDDISTFKLIMKKCAENKLTVLIHPEFKKFIIESKTQLNSNNKIENFLKIHNDLNEIRTIQKIFEICNDLSIHIHLCHLSVAKDLELLSNFKNLNTNLKITAEVTPHHLFLDESFVFKLGTFAKMLPPLRSKNNQKELLKGLKQGIIDIIGTDHAPHSIEEKNLDFEKAPSGIPNLETTLPLLLTKVNHNEFSIAELCKFYSEFPAKIFNLNKKGKIIENYDADLVIVDPKIEFKIDSSKFYTKAKFSPFDGFKCKGKPIMTIVNGSIQFQDEELIGEKGSGSILFNKIN